MISFNFLHLMVFLVRMPVIIAHARALVPENSWDSHLHVIEPEKYPLAPDRGKVYPDQQASDPRKLSEIATPEYTPRAATRRQAASFHKSLGIKHGVIVLPSVYDFNNSVLLDALRYFNGTYRGVCVLDLESEVQNSTLDEYHSVGVRGIRLNYGNAGSDAEISAAVIKAAAIARLKDWVLELWIPLRAFVSLRSIIPTLGVRVVADHYAHAMVGSRTNHSRDTIDPFQITGFREAVELVRDRYLFVKISAPYQNSQKAPLYDDMRVIAETLIANGPEMVVFGSDWPHTSSKEGNAAAGGPLVPQDFRDIDDSALLREAKSWAGSDAQTQRLFVDNPRRLWAFGDVDL